MWVWIFLQYLLLIVSVIKADIEEWREVNIVQGPVRGRKDPNSESYIFYNIPYATAPSGEQKFKAPLPPPKWTQPYEATDKRIICPQFFDPQVMPGNFSQQENCLIANLYVPDTKNRNLSVLVYIHGGAFIMGYGEWRKPTKLMKTKDLIAVTFNYRLGIHGFLCLGTEYAPGNAGMKDQVALLRWIQQNIAAFGGNPNDVTIAGYSAGSTSVDLLMISKYSQELFHKVIIESGTNLAVFTLQGDPVKNAKDHAKTLNFTNVDDLYALEAFYKTLPYDILISNVFLERPDSTFVFSPCLERDTEDEVFLTESPLSILKRSGYKKIPSLYGFANMEGQFRIKLLDVGWTDKMNEKFSDFLPADLKFETEYERQKVANQVKWFYFGNKPVNADNILGYVDYFSDVMFIFATLRAIKLHVDAGHKEIYLYEYSFTDDDTPFILNTNVRGANHCGETMAVLDGKNMTYFSEDDLTKEFQTMKKIMRELWHNFVKTGMPVPKRSSIPALPPVGPNGTLYMSLGQKLDLRSQLMEKMFHFWDNIYEQYYREPIPPREPPY